MAFALFTNLAWDDWYITYRASKNLALGYGLTYTPGERIHSFTSPLGTLIPAFLCVVTANRSDDLVLWLYRIINSLALAAGAVLLLYLARQLKLHPWATFTLIGLTITESKILANSINGMESAWVVFFLSLSLYAFSLLPGARSTLLLGIAWSGLMWTRPDGFIYIIGPCAGFLLFRPGRYKGLSRSTLLRNWFLAGLLVCILYTPWLLWARSYYGSFVPHTIIAKGYSFHLHPADEPFTTAGLQLLVRIRTFLVGHTQVFAATFIPPYGTTFGGWAGVAVLLSKVVAWACAFAWVLPFIRPAARATSLAACFGQLYLNFGTEFPFPWYFPPVTLLSICVCALVLDQAIGSLEAVREARAQSEDMQRRALMGVKALAGAAILGTLVITLSAAWQLRMFQAFIYQGTYKPAGLWLRDHAASRRDTVFLEPLGYIGFFSNLKMYDYPGLSSEEMIHARKTIPPHTLKDRTHFAELISYLNPDWIVLRPSEATVISRRDPALLTQRYHAVQRFDVRQNVESKRFLPGRGWFALDEVFLIFQANRRAPPGSGDPPSPNAG